MPLAYLLSCEHADNLVPAAYKHLFDGREEVLYTHRAIDLGALRLATALATAAQLPLYYTAVTRLLVEANRSEGNASLFSEFSNHLPDAEKQALLSAYYFPHRHQVEYMVREAIAAQGQVLHVAVHTFTPLLHGEVREADIGILFDPARPLEQAFADAYQRELLARNPSRKVYYNSPYLGTADGLPTYLRTVFPSNAYGGIELEVNQKFFLAGEPAVWDALVQDLTAAFLAVLDAPSLPTVTP